MWKGKLSCGLQMTLLHKACNASYSTTISDERLKTGITTVTDALNKVKQIRGVEFTRKNNGQRGAGVIAH